MLAGMSMGGYHCVNLYLRRPDLFGGCLSLSGLFHAGYFFPNYDDVDIYYNSPVDYLPQMPQDHPLVGAVPPRKDYYLLRTGCMGG